MQVCIVESYILCGAVSCFENRTVRCGSVVVGKVVRCGAVVRFGKPHRRDAPERKNRSVKKPRILLASGVSSYV